MKAVLISIQPKWCELIASGKKTVEVRKTKPKLETPFKVYIYCTKDPAFAEKTLRGFDENGKAIYYKANKGKVIGEFVCDEICEYEAYKWRQGGFEGLNYKYDSDLSEKSCVTQDELMKYGRRKTLYGWHVSNLVFYEKPMALSDFCKCGALSIGELADAEELCRYCSDTGYGESCYKAYQNYLDEEFSLVRPPQSWCYVEERSRNDRK